MPRLVRFGTDLTPILGGPAARINRLGSRYAVDIQLPTLDNDVGPVWIAAQLQSDVTNATTTLVWPSALYENATPVANGGGQAGSNLAISGMPAGAVIPALIPFSLYDGTRNYLYLTTEEVTASSGGQVTLPLSPMLRNVVTNGMAVNMAGPIIEGFILGTAISWELQLARFNKISFTLQENA